MVPPRIPLENVELYQAKESVMVPPVVRRALSSEGECGGTSGC